MTISALPFAATVIRETSVDSVGAMRLKSPELPAAGAGELPWEVCPNPRGLFMSEEKLLL